jgi:putative polyhydroxyalkanoic acid system protein
MNQIKVREYHNLPDMNVKKRIDSYFENIKRQHEVMIDSIIVKWNGKNAEVKLNIVGLKIKGNIHLEEEQITVTGELPAVAEEYKEKLEHIVRYELYELLN